jgi:hypothetical protein
LDGIKSGYGKRQNDRMLLLIDEGYPVTPDIIARLSPYKTEHINRFGRYELHFDHLPPPMTEDLRLAPTRAVG